MRLPFILIGSIILLNNSSVFADNPEKQVSAIEQGKAIAFQQKKGNCLACHAIKGGKLPGNIGPPLINMQQRYPNKKNLKAQIKDASENNPNSIMPPFAKHRILSETELDNVVEFIYSL